MDKNADRFLGDETSVQFNGDFVDLTPPTTTTELYSLLQVANSDDATREAAVNDWLTRNTPEPSLRSGLERAAKRRQRSAQAASDALGPRPALKLR